LQLGFSDVQQLRRALNTHREATPMSSVRKVVNKFNAQPKSPEHTYNDSSTFLKGTQSSNPHNDYCQHFVDTGQRPQNFIRDVGLTDRFEEYPKLRELIRLKVLIYNINLLNCLFMSEINTYRFSNCCTYTILFSNQTIIS